MKPVDIPEKAKTARPWASVGPLGPPRGVSDDECGTVEIQREHLSDSTFPDRIRVAFALEEGDLEKLANGAHVWLTVFASTTYPFSVDIDGT